MSLKTVRITGFGNGKEPREHKWRNGRLMHCRVYGVGMVCDFVVSRMGVVTGPEAINYKEILKLLAGSLEASMP